MADLRPFNFKKPKELRQIIGRLLDENAELEARNDKLQRRLAECAPTINDDDVEYLYKWECPQCKAMNEGEFTFGGSSLVGDVVTCDHCNAEVEVIDD